MPSAAAQSGIRTEALLEILRRTLPEVLRFDPVPEEDGDVSDFVAIPLTTAERAVSLTVRVVVTPDLSFEE